ncbi:hypothetical protein K0504_05370 [Neiella marina]|uniref:Uncharacterized protein n=1 Tax=Neiella holothuriorum TaxID=2870530 RepID=A0ABS7EDY6_9GAMM|nr:hypothetical protein [Neiella holothuriorum]MBW8190460.1 hypothetical protein [Neiella holothuriorum]
MELRKLRMTLAALAIAAAPLAAQAADCSDVEWHPDVLAAFPEAPQSCQGVIEKDGAMFVKMKAEFVSITGKRVRLRIEQNDGARKMHSFVPEAPISIMAGGKATTWRELYSGYKMNIYIPSDRFELASVDSEEAVEMAAEMPKTASVWPLVGMLGAGLLVVAGFARRLRRR